MFTVSKSDEKLMVELIGSIYKMNTQEVTKKDIVREAKKLPKTLRQDMLSHKSISPDFKMAIGVVR